MLKVLAKSPQQFNPIPGNCKLFLPLWHNELRGGVFSSADDFRHACTVTNATWGSQGRTMAGTGRITVPDHNSLDFGATTDFSYGVWAKRTSAGDTIESIIFKGDSVNPGTWFAIRSLNDGGSGVATTNIDDNVTLKSVTGTTDLRDSMWHLLFTTCDRDGNMTLYVDAVSEGTPIDISAVGNITDTEDLYLGAFRSDDVVTALFNGTIGESYVYNRVLSLEEITQIYNLTKFRYQ